jgi:ribosomal protein S18 acetylase RimI-like enzyme
MKKVSYQKIDITECDKLKPLIHQLGYNLESFDIENNINEIRQRGGEVFVARVNEEVIACINAIIDVRLAAGRNGEIVTLVVLEQYRGMGVGKALLATAEAWLAERVATIRVRTNTVRVRAQQFYLTAGYQELKTQKIFIKNL